MIDLEKLEKLAEEIKEAEKNEPIKKLTEYWNGTEYKPRSNAELKDKINEIIEALNPLLK